MEVSTFYEDGFGNRGNALKRMKSNMTLDFNSKKLKMEKAGINTLLASPDLQMLKLASPDLEKLIMIQSNGMVATTPTPTSHSQIICPKSVTEEQEAYARGFVDALAELHKNEPDEMDVQSNGEVTEIPQSSTYTTLTTVSAPNPVQVGVMSQPQMMATSVSAGQPVMTSLPQPTLGNAFTTTTRLPGSILPNAANGDQRVAPSPEYQVPSPHYASLQSMPTSRTQSPALSLSSSIANVPTTVSAEHMLQLKEEPQTVPNYCPIDMVNQEKIKLDRKRARNRLAARKCRTRKLERISRLEDRVTELKGQNSELSASATALREQVCKLKEQIMVHVNSGCKVMLSPNLL